MDERRRLSEIIEAARNKKGWTREQFAEKLDKDYMTVYRQETNRKSFGDETLQKACQLLGLDFRDMLQLKKPMLKIKEEDAPSYLSEIERSALKSLDNAQKQGIIPPRLPVGVVELIVGELTSNGEGSYTMEQVRNAYVNVRDSNPLIHTQCEICEAMCSPALSEQDLEEILAILQFKIDKKESNP